VCSIVRQPIYLPGRYDTIVLPVCLMLMAVGLDRLVRVRWWMGSGVAVVLLWLAALSWSPAMGPTVVPDPLNRAAGEELARVAAPGDLVVSTSLRQSVAAYYAYRGGFLGTVTSFPSEITQHPGWYSAPRMLHDRDQLAADGEAVAQCLVAAARAGHGVWILGSAPNEVDDNLWNPLLRLMDIDEARSHPEVGLVRLTLRTN
jgi:hypothetical protein